VKSIGIVIPFLNEQSALESVVNSITFELRKEDIPYEILLVNDGSSDRSGVIGDQLASLDENISIIHNATSKNIGSAFKEGLKFFNTDLVCWIPSDGEIPARTIIDCYKVSVEYNCPCISYPANTFEVRTIFRGVLSKVFQASCRLVFGIPIRYFNGITVYKRENLKKLNLISNGFTINLELIIRHATHFFVPFKEVPFNLNKRMGGEEKALQFSNILNVLKFLFFLKLKSK